MPSSSSIVATAPDWRALRKCGSSAIESSEHERVDDLAHLAGRAQQADVGAAVATRR